MSENQQEVNNVKIITWNVNGIRSLYKDAAAVKEGLDSLDGDIICLQETKITRTLLGISILGLYSCNVNVRRALKEGVMFSSNLQ
jgi:AP endonuclease-2